MENRTVPISHENNGGTATVSAIDPVMSIGRVDNPALLPIAKEVRTLLEKILKSIV